jgi:hypothetical protein
MNMMPHVVGIASAIGLLFALWTGSLPVIVILGGWCAFHLYQYGRYVEKK